MGLEGKHAGDDADGTLIAPVVNRVASEYPKLGKGVDAGSACMLRVEVLVSR